MPFAPSLPVARRLSRVHGRSGLSILAAVGLGSSLAGHALGQSGSVTVTVPGTANPWLAGMPDGSSASGDTAPQASPLLVPFAFAPGAMLSVSNASGTTGYSSGIECPPDGCPYGNLCDYAQNGIAGACWYTASGLVGVFLDDTVPTSTPTPDPLYFSDPASLDYTVLHPLLKQVFFVGDGLTSTGAPQSFVAPPGATRLFLGTVDGSGWYNNVGAFTVTVNGGCAGITSQPTSHLVCTLGSAQFAVGIAAPSATYQWQIQTAPGVWMTLGNDPGPLPCGGGAFAYATPVNSASVRIGIRGCPGSPTAAQRFQVRSIVTTPCVTLTSAEATYTLCPADYNCSGQLNVQDIFDFLNGWFAGSALADFNTTGGVTVQDIFDFLSAWFAGC